MRAFPGHIKIAVVTGKTGAWIFLQSDKSREHVREMLFVHVHESDLARDQRADVQFRCLPEKTSGIGLGAVSEVRKDGLKEVTIFRQDVVL